MMQKRTLYLSFLLVSCLLIFGFTSAFGQTVTFVSQTAPRCEDVTMNIVVKAPVSISGFDIIFQVSGDYTGSPVVDFTGFSGLETRVGPIDLGGGAYRLSAFKDCDDACLDVTGPTGVVVGDITFHTADVCTGAIEVVGAMAPSTACCVPDAYTALIDCPVGEMPTTVEPGQIMIENRDVAFVDCPTDTLVFHWGDNATFDVEATDPDLYTGCEDLTFTVLSADGAMTKTGDSTATFDWQTDCPDVGYHTVSVEVMDKCGDADTCNRVICVYNDPPVITNEDPMDTLYSVWCITLCDQVEAMDPDSGCNSLLYTILSFDGPTWFGNGLTMDPATGDWCWDIAEDNEYLGNFELCAVVSDGANITPGCSPSNADTACYNINITGFSITIEKVHEQLQGHFADVSIYIDSAYMPDQFCCDLLGGFDFLIAYDASALTATSVDPGALIDNGKFEYFTYRFGANGNCDGGCPTGMLRIVSMRESNDGVMNPYHLTGPGELAVMHFLVTNDYNFADMYVPIQFYWLDCGDNTLSDESGNWLYLALKVYNHEGEDQTDPAELFGYSGPEGYCYDTVYTAEQTFKNAPIGAVIFRNGGVDIIPKENIDDRGDINLNGIDNEIADAVVFTNYFIYGPGAFTINFEGQKAATEVNGDGIALTVADLVYLIRIIVGDATPLPKVNPAAEAEFVVQGHTVSVNSDYEMGAALLVFNGVVTPTLASNAGHMDMIYNQDGNSTRVLIYSLEKDDAITSGDLLSIDGAAELVKVETAEYRGATMKANYEVRPENYALKQNYPNPFNPTTTIEMELPVASDWTITIYNVTGQRIADYSGHSDAGVVHVEWNAEGAASGLYFYKATAGQFSATKKMVLLK